MISLFKPATRPLSIGAAVLVVAVACITFTGASPKPRKAQAPPSPESDSRERALLTLENELHRIKAQINDSEKTLEHYRRELRIPSHIANGDGHQPGPHAETLRKLESLRIDAEADLQRISTLVDHLGAMPRQDLRKAIQTAVPDQQLSGLLERLADVELKLVSVQETFTADHPEVKALRRTWEKVNQQVDERLDGVLAGLRARRASSEAQAKQMKGQMEEYARDDIEAPIRYREYFNLKRELENLYIVRDRLHLRLLDEKIDAALPRK